MQVVLVALPGVDMTAVEAELAKQCDALPRNETARRALGHSFAVHVDGKAQAIAFSNAYAPEHLIVNVEDAESWLPQLDNAGSVFLGRWTPESVGDYASGERAAAAGLVWGRALPFSSFSPVLPLPCPL